MTSKIDGVHTFEAQQKNQKQINMVYDSQIIENYSPGKVINDKDINALASVQDSKGNPVAFVLKANNELAVIRKSFNEQNAMGYQEKIIGGSANKKIQSFGVNQNIKTGAYSIAVVKENKSKSGKMDIYITKPLPNDSSTMHASFLDDDNGLWNYRGSINIAPADEITQVLVGDFPLEEENNESPGILVTTSENNKAFYYIVDSDLNNETPENPEKISLGDTSTHIIDFTIGKMSYFEGVYTLQRLGDNRYLRFHGFPVNNGTGPSTLLHTFKNNEDPKSIEVLAEDEDYRSGVYIAGNGLYYLSSKAQQKSSEENKKEGKNKELPLDILIKPQKAEALQKITLRDDSDSITLWALNGKKQMLTSEQKKTSVSGYTNASKSEEWLDPMVIAHGVEGWAAIRNQVEKTNDLMILKAGNKLSHLIQDNKSTNYRHTDIALDDAKFMQNYSSYSTQLTFQDKDGFAHITIEEDDKGFGISASEWCEVSINGFANEMRANEINYVKTDMQGIITLVHKADSISPPIFTVRINNKKRIVNPAKKVDEKLVSIKDSNTLKKEKWVDENGEKHDLVSSTVKEENLKAAVEGIQNFSKIIKDLPEDGSIASKYLNLSDLKANNRTEIWGMSISPEGDLNYFESEEVYLNMSSDEEKSWWEKAIERAAGNVLEWMKGIARDFVQIVVKAVEGVWKIAIKIGEEMYSFAVKCLGHLYNGINWLLDKALGIDLEKIRKWIGFVFNIKEVREAHQLISHITKEIPVYARLKLKGLSSEVNEFFDRLIKDVDKLKEIDHEFARQGYSNSKEKILKENMSEADRTGMEDILKSPAGNFMNYHVLNQSQRNSPKLEDLFQNGEIQTFLDENKDEMNKIIAELNKLKGPLEEMGKNLAKINSGNLSLNQAIKLVFGESIKLFLNSAKTITNLIFILIDGLLDILEKITTDPIHIPFLTPLVQFLLHSNKPLSTTDHLVLPLAMPVVVLYKLLFHKDSKDPVFDSAGMAKILSLNGEALMDYLCKPQSTQDVNIVIVVMEKIQSIGGAFTSLAGNALSLISAVGGKVSMIFDVAFGVLNLFAGIPLQNFNAYSITNSVISVLQIFIGAIPGPLGSFLNAVADVVKGFLSFIKLIQEFASSKKLAILIWGGINDILSVINSCLIAATEIAKPTPKAQAVLAILTSGLVTAEFITGLSHSIVDAAVPGS